MPTNSPFSSLNVANTGPLHDPETAQRATCPRCEKSAMHLCYRCPRILADPSLVPRLALPLPLDIIRDPRELVGKSTACHAKVLAPDEVSIYSPENADDYPEEYTAAPGKCLLLFPTEDAVPLADIPNLASYSRIVVLDGTWRQCQARLRTEPMWAKFTKVTLGTPRETLFWRYQKFGKSHLATIEAIYYLLVEYWERTHEAPYAGELDNLLFFFKYQWEVIQDSYKASGRTITSRLEGSAEYIKT